MAKEENSLKAKRQNGGPHWFFDNFQKNKILIKLKNARHLRGSKI
jgi:small nuclear ribonucleoprotein (snRNP)-like protein